MSGIVLVGGSRLLRGGLKLMLEETGAEVLGNYSRLEELRSRSPDVAPVVYLLMHAKGCRGIRQEIAELRRIDPESRIAVMLAELAANDLVEVFTAGGDGLVLEEIGAQALHDSLRLIALGEKVFPSQLATLLGDSRRRADTVLKHIPLTGREVEVIHRLTLGRSNKEIANELDLALATVKVHVKSLLKKLGLSNRTQAAIWALDAGLVDPPKVTVKADGERQERATVAGAAERASERAPGISPERQRTSPESLPKRPTTATRAGLTEVLFGSNPGYASPRAASISGEG